MPPTILVVEDEPSLREVLALLLADEGYRVDTASDGREALDHLVLHSPDLIVSDIKMPRMHGLTLVERIRADGSGVPVILISTWVPPEELPGVRFLRKPFDITEILQAVEESLADLPHDDATPGQETPG